MLQTIIREVSERLGTGLGSALSAYGVSSGDLTILLAALPVLLGLLVDIGTRNLFNKRKA